MKKVEGLNKEEEAYVDKMLDNLAKGKIRKWHLKNSSPKFNSRNARIASKTLAKSGISRRHMDRVRASYNA